MARLGAGSRLGPQCGLGGHFALLVVAKKQQGMAAIWDRICLSRCLLSCDVFRFWLLTFYPKLHQIRVSSELAVIRPEH